MTVTAAIAPGAPAGIQELQAALAQAGVVFLADLADMHEVAASLADAKFSTQDKIIARGQPALPGKDGYFEPAFHVGIQPGHLDASGTMDFFDRELLKPVQQDDYVGQLHQPIAGSAGRRVDGSAIPVAPVRPSKLQIGAGLRSAADGRVYAEHEGAVLYVPEKSLSVSRKHIHQGDVNLRSGNLSMQGSLVVSGSVQRQFSVRGSHDVEILGNVESGSVFAGSWIKIRGGVRGGDSGLICAEADITLHHAEAAQIRCGGSLQLDSAINSELTAANIRIGRVLRGGVAQAEESVVATEIGAAHGGGTTVAVAVPIARPVLDAQQRVGALKEQRMLHKSNSARSDSERGKGGKVGRAQAALQKEALARTVAHAERRQALLGKAAIRVSGTTHAGVRVQVGAHVLVLDADVTNTRFSYDAQTRHIRMERSVQ
jgi:uncharacterized protein (DUF342 family)